MSLLEVDNVSVRFGGIVTLILSTVIIGYGVKGRSAAQGLVDAGVEKSQIVVVAHERAIVDEAARAANFTNRG